MPPTQPTPPTPPASSARRTPPRTVPVDPRRSAALNAEVRASVLLLVGALAVVGGLTAALSVLLGVLSSFFLLTGAA